MTPEDVSKVDVEFMLVYDEMTCKGTFAAAKRRIGWVGLARDCNDILGRNLALIEKTSRFFAGWRAFVFENDSTDGTKETLAAWADRHAGPVDVQLTDNGKPRLRGTESQRMLALADYRSRCQDHVRRHMPDVDYVAVVDFDAQGGWAVFGIMNGIGWHESDGSIGCLGSVSLFHIEGMKADGKMMLGHYDCWAYRWIGWRPRHGPWFATWIPPVGAPPIVVNSVFGGLAIYKREAFLDGEYGRDGDCEHVGLHRTMKAKGWQVALNPAQRTLMSWIDERKNEEM